MYECIIKFTNLNGQKQSLLLSTRIENNLYFLVNEAKLYGELVSISVVESKKDA